MTKIISIDTTPYIDPYPRYTGQLTKTGITIYPNDNEIIVDQELESNSTSMDIWNGQVLFINMGNWYPKEAELKDFLESEEVQEILEKVISNHNEEWNGNNWIGYLNDEGQKAFEEFEQMLENFDGDLDWHSVEDWCCDSCRENITAETTDEELKNFAKDWDDPDFTIIGDILEHITEYRNEKIEEKENED